MLASRRVGLKRRRVAKPKDGTTVVTAPQAQIALAKKVAKLAKVVRGIAPEKKLIDGTGNFTNVADTVGAVIALSGMAQGTELNERVGDRIRVKGLMLNTRVSTSSLGATPTNEEFSRFILIQDTQQVSDTAPTAAVVVAQTALPQFPVPNADSMGRFKWLWVSPLIHHARIANSSLIAALTTPLTPSQSPVSFYKNDRMDMPMIFNGPNATDIQKNHLYMVMITNVAADTVDGDINIRLTYIDD